MESLQGFDLSSEMIAERLLVIARVKDGLGWKKLSRKLLLVIGSGGCRTEGVQSHPRGTDSVLCRGDISHDGRPPEKEQASTHVVSSVLGVLNLRCLWTKWGKCSGEMVHCNLEVTWLQVSV